MPMSAAHLPAEIWLDIIPHIPYSPHQLACLRLTCRALNDLIQNHEHSLVTAIKATQLPLSAFPEPTFPLPTSVRLFPNLHLAQYADLKTLWDRMSTLESLNTKWLHIVTSSEEFHWLEGRWTAIHKAGLLLLYRLQDTQTYDEKLDLLHSLPKTSLACLLFKLISSVKILRVFGPEPIHMRFALGCPSTRAEIELACEELLLVHGPDFFVSLLGNGGAESRSWATERLTREFEGMETRQRDAEKPPTLISGLRRAFASRCGAEVQECVGRMWEVLSCSAFDDLGEEKLGMVVKGVEVRCGMRRMGF